MALAPIYFALLMGFLKVAFLFSVGVGWWNVILWFFVIAWMAWCGIQQICSFNEGVVDTSHVLPGQARGEQSDWIATFPWDEDKCRRWVLGKGNHGWLTALLYLAVEIISVPIMMDPSHQSFEKFPNCPRTPGPKAHKYVRALYHALSRAILGEVGSHKADPNFSAIHSWNDHIHMHRWSQVSLKVWWFLCPFDWTCNVVDLEY